MQPVQHITGLSQEECMLVLCAELEAACWLLCCAVLCRQEWLLDWLHRGPCCSTSCGGCQPAEELHIQVPQVPGTPQSAHTALTSSSSTTGSPDCILIPVTSGRPACVCRGHGCMHAAASAAKCNECFAHGVTVLMTDAEACCVPHSCCKCSKMPSCTVLCCAVLLCAWSAVLCCAALCCQGEH